MNSPRSIGVSVGECGVSGVTQRAERESRKAKARELTKCCNCVFYRVELRCHLCYI